MKKWSLRYALLRHAFGFAFYRFYRNIEIHGQDNIPTDCPVIFNENHTNAFIDPVIIAAIQPLQPGFLARSDVFKNNLLDKLFRGFKMLPVYRQRDNVNTIQANQPIFDAVVNHLDRGGALIIAPEGDKGIDHHLLRLKKGTARIAVQQMERHNWDSDLCLVPIGITYSDYLSWRSDVIIRFGEPIPVRQFKKAYDQAPDYIFKVITEELAEQIKQLIWQVDDKDWLPWFYKLKKLNGQRKSFKEHMDWAHEKLALIQVTDMEVLQKIEKQLDNYLDLLERDQLADKDVIYAQSSSKGLAFLSLILLVPFALVNFLFHALPLNLAKWILQWMDPHPHFYASILFGLLFLLMPVFYLLYFIIGWSLTGSWWVGLLLIFILPWVAIISRQWHKCWRLFNVAKSHRQKRAKLMGLLEML